MANTARYHVPAVTLGWRLRMSMEGAGIKRDQMAERMGVTRATITRWTHDIGSPPRAIYLEKWANLTGVPLGWLEDVDDAVKPNVNPEDTAHYLPSRRSRRSRTVAVQSPLVAQVA